MNENLKNIANDMKELGLAALSHANKRYSNMDKGGELSVLKAAHAAEILIKAKIAEEHPLLIFDKLPKIQDTELSLEKLFEEGYTKEWAKLPDLLWAATGNTIENIDIYKDFGKLRNGIQHFGIIPNKYKTSTSAEKETFKFIYKVIEPMLMTWWNLPALDYCEDKVPEDYTENEYENNLYWEFVRFVISEELTSNLTDLVIQNVDKWQSALEGTSEDYQNEINSKISQSN